MSWENAAEYDVHHWHAAESDVHHGHHGHAASFAPRPRRSGGQEPPVVCRCGVDSTILGLSSCFSIFDVDSDMSKAFVGFVIIVNAAVIGLETEYGDGNFSILENMFTAIFVSEMMLKIRQWGFCTYIRCWRNLFDASLALLSVADMWVLPWIPDKDDNPEELHQLKMLRLFRVLRLLRLFSVFRELSLILDAFIKAMLPVFWVTVLILIFDYVCAIFLTQTIGRNAAWWGAKEDQITGWFGTVGRSMRTLFIIMTLAEWDGIVLVLSEQMNGLVVFLFAMCYIFITAYTMLSIITGSISEALITAERQDELHKIQEAEQASDELAQGVAQLLTNIDVDGSGFISSAELKEAYATPGNRIEATLTSLDLKMNFHDLTELIERLETSGAGEDGEVKEISIDEVSDAIANMSGTAKSHTVMAVKHLFAKKEQDAAERFDHLQVQIAETQEQFGNIDSKLNTLLAKYDIEVPDHMDPQVLRTTSTLGAVNPTYVTKDRKDAYRRRVLSAPAETWVKGRIRSSVRMAGRMATKNSSSSSASLTR